MRPGGKHASTQKDPGMGLPTRMTGGGGGDEQIKIMTKTTQPT